jgi:hypothetical protein
MLSDCLGLPYVTMYHVEDYIKHYLIVLDIHVKYLDQIKYIYFWVNYTKFPKKKTLPFLLTASSSLSGIVNPDSQLSVFFV